MQFHTSSRSWVGTEDGVSLRTLSTHFGSIADTKSKRLLRHRRTDVSGTKQRVQVPFWSWLLLRRCVKMIPPPPTWPPPSIMLRWERGGRKFPLLCQSVVSQLTTWESNTNSNLKKKGVLQRTVSVRSLGHPQNALFLI